MAELDSQTNSVLGTAIYAPPEAFDNRLQPTVDIYCLASTYVRLRTGHYPFGNTGNQIQQRKIDIDFHTTGLEPLEIDVLHRALAADPTAREYATAGAFATALASQPPSAAHVRRLAPAKLSAVLSPANFPDGLPQLINTVGGILTRIPSGEFLMGSPESESRRGNNEFQHWVRITKPFYMGIHPVTVGQFMQFIEATGYKANTEAWNGREFQQDAIHPAVGVSWDDAQKFCQWLSEQEGRSFGLPSEAEWEYACRGGIGEYAVFGIRGGKVLTSALANFNGNYPYGCGQKGPWLRWATPIGTYNIANEFGLFDMHGNVWEWCQDWYDADYYRKSPKDDPTGPEAGSHRVLRGGSWYSPGSQCRSACRHYYDSSSQRSDFGFRLVCR